VLLLPLLRLHALTMDSAVPQPSKVSTAAACQAKQVLLPPASIWVMIPPSVPMASDLFGFFFFFYCVLVVVDQLWLGGVTVMAMVTRM
jgi:hypothetical protein